MRLVGDASTGKVSAYYAINGSSTFTKIPYDLTLSGATKTAFFNTAARGGIPDAELQKMIDHSYDLVKASLPRKARATLA